MVHAACACAAHVGWEAGRQRDAGGACNVQARVRKKISVQGKGGGERASKNIGPYDVGDMRAGRRERVGRWRCKERAWTRV